MGIAGVNKLFVRVIGAFATKSGDGFLFGGILYEAERSEDFIESVVAKLMLVGIGMGGGGISIDMFGAHVVGIHRFASMDGFVGNGTLKDKSAVAVFIKPLLDSGLENQPEEVGCDLVPRQGA